MNKNQLLAAAIVSAVIITGISILALYTPFYSAYDKKNGINYKVYLDGYVDQILFKKQKGISDYDCALKVFNSDLEVVCDFDDSRSSMYIVLIFSAVAGSLTIAAIGAVNLIKDNKLIKIISKFGGFLLAFSSCVVVFVFWIRFWYFSNQKSNYYDLTVSAQHVILAIAYIIFGLAQNLVWGLELYKHLKGEDEVLISPIMV